MAAEDWLPDCFDPYDEDEYGDGAVTCKFCGEDGLMWEEARGLHNRKRWVLVDERGDIHDCPKRPGAAPSDEFDDLDAPVD